MCEFLRNVKNVSLICVPSLAVYKNDDLKFVVVQQRAPLVKVIIVLGVHILYLQTTGRCTINNYSLKSR